MQLRATSYIDACDRTTAELIAEGLGGRRVGRDRWRCRCPVHGHRSLEITEGVDGKPLWKCWGGCTQDQVRDALVALGLWPERNGSGWQPSPPRFSWLESIAREPEPCCLQGRCTHWDEFDVQILMATLMGNLDAAVSELRQKYQRAGRTLDVRTLRSEIVFALQFGGIASAELPQDVVTEVFDHVVGKVAPAQEFTPLVMEFAEAMDGMEETER